MAPYTFVLSSVASFNQANGYNLVYAVPDSGEAEDVEGPLLQCFFCLRAEGAGDLPHHLVG